MSKIIENPKSYVGHELDTVFFRPMLTGPNAENLGIRVLYNMPVPTTLQFWSRSADILKTYSKGWHGADPAEKFQKTIKLQKVKAELGYSAEDYFSMVYENIVAADGVNLEDMSGSSLEEAETTLFKESIMEAIRATMWVGDTTRQSTMNTFDGFLKNIMADQGEDENEIKAIELGDPNEQGSAAVAFKALWENASEVLKDTKNQGQLVLLVTSDVYANYEDSLDDSTVEAAYIARQEGRNALMYRGIPVVDVQITSYLAQCQDLPQSFAILTDRRNLALAVNTTDFPGMEVRMWYNPDEIENRQRAVFMAGCDYLLPELIVVAVPETFI